MHENPRLRRPERRPIARSKRVARAIAVAVATVALILPMVGEAAAQFRGGFGGAGFGGSRGGSFGGSFGGGGFGGGGLGGDGIGRINTAPGGMIRSGGRTIDTARGLRPTRIPAKRFTGHPISRPGTNALTHKGGAKTSTLGDGRRGLPDKGQVAGCRGGDCPQPKRPHRHPSRSPVVLALPVLGPVFVSPYDYVSSGGPNGNLPPSSRATGPQSPSPRRVSGIPPSGENRYVRDQVVAVLQGTLSERQINRFLGQHRLARTANGAQRLALINARVFRLRITDGAAVPRVVAALERDRRVVFVQPNYWFMLAQGQDTSGTSSEPPAGSTLGEAASEPAKEKTAAAAPDLPKENAAAASSSTTATSALLQYAIARLQVPQAHKVARGERILVAVIDSRIDADHPELAGAIVKQIDVLDDKDAAPHAHGTAMAGAIVARSRLMGIAPDARVVAVRAFTTTTRGSASSTSFDLARAIDQSAAADVRIINLSFAGPADPLVATALQAAGKRGIVLVAAAGNAGPKSPPLYPAADPNVIAVTATDADDKVYKGANHGKYIALAAPGVDVLVPAPQSNYELSTGTSVAAAHVSGVVALLLARNPALDPAAIRQILVRSAHALGPAPDNIFGAGMADAYRAIMILDPAGPAPTGVATQ